MAEILAGDAAHETDGCEHRHDGQRDRDHREADLVGSLERGAIGRFAHPDMPHDVLDLDDRIIDQDAGHQSDRQQADQVERETQRIHRPERRHDRQRQGDGGHDRGAQIAQEDEHHEHGERGAFDQRVHRRAIIADRVGDGAVDQREPHAGLSLAEPGEFGLDGLGDPRIAGTARAADAEGDDGAAIEACEDARLGDRVLDLRDIVEPELAPAGDHDLGLREIGKALGGRQCADRLFLAAELGAATREIDAGRLQLPIDLGGGDSERSQTCRIEADADLAIGAADALHRADAAQSLQTADHGVVDEPREFLDRLGRGIGRVGEDRQPGDVEPADDRFVDGARQVGAHLGDGVLDVVDRAIGIGLQTELDRRGRLAVRDLRDHVLHAGDSGDAVLDPLGDLFLQLDRCGAGLRDRDRHDRDVDIRKQRDRQGAKADDAENSEHEK